MTTISSNITLTQTYINSVTTWPITISGGTLASPIVVRFGGRLTLTGGTTRYFNIGSQYVTIDGSYNTVVISSIQNYLGLVRNGVPNSNSGYSNVTVQNIDISCIGTTSVLGTYSGNDGSIAGGFLCQAGFARLSSNNIVQNCSCIMNANSPNNYAGGLFGVSASQSGNLIVRNCYVIGNAGNDGGIIFGAFAASGTGSRLEIINCYSIGGGGGYGSGGIVGPFAISNSSSTSRIIIQNCYNQTGSFGGSNGAIFGYAASGFGTRGYIDISNCYASSSNQLFGSDSDTAYITQANCYAAGGSWSDTTANSNLITNAGVWVDISLGATNVPWRLASAMPNVSLYVPSTVTFDATNITTASGTLSSPYTYSVIAVNGNSTLPAGFSINSSTGVINASSGSSFTYNVRVIAQLNANYGYAIGNILIIARVLIPPTITFTIPNKGYNETFNVNAESNSDGLFTYTSGNASVATVSGNTVTTVGLGTASIRVDQASTDVYQSGNVTTSFTVSKGTPVVSNFPSTVSWFYGNNYPYNTTSTNTIGNISYQSSNTNIATVDAFGVVTPLDIGSTVIRFTQESTDEYNDISLNSTFTVNKGNPVISLSNISKTFGNPSFQINATSNPTSTGAYTYSSGNLFVANITSGNTVNVISAGSTTISVSQEETTYYNSAIGNATIIVDKASPNITFSNISKTYGDPIFRIDPSSNPVSDSDGAFTFSSSNTNVLQITDFSANIVGAGSATITASQAESTNYLARDVSATLTVAKTSPNITFSNISKTYGDPIFRIDPSSNPVSNSSGAFTFSSSNTNVLQITDFSANIVGAGSATITASQAESNNYLARDVSAVISVAKANPMITFSDISKTYGDTIFRLEPTSNSSGTFTFSSPDINIVRITDFSANIVGTGTATITASQAETDNYLSRNVSAYLYVAPGNSVIGAFTIDSKTFGDISFALTQPSSLSTGSFSYSSGNLLVADIVNGNYIDIKGAGSAVITATQAADNNYNQGSVSTTFVVAKALPNISGFTVPNNKVFGDVSFGLVIPTTPSTGAFSYTSGNTTVASIVGGNVVAINGAGNTVITATQATDNNYLENSVNATFYVAKAVPNLGGFPNVSKTYGDVSFGLTQPTSLSTGAFTYTSGNTSVINLFGNIANIYGAGTSIITATQEETDNYLSQDISATINVAKALPEISWFTVSNKAFNDPSFGLIAPTTQSTGAFTYSSGNTSIATIAGNIVTIQSVGNTVLTATQATDSNYLQRSVTANLVVVRANVNLTSFTVPNKVFNDLSFVLTIPTTQSTGAFTYTSGNTSIATIAGNVVSIQGAGNTVITATQAQTANYNSGNITSTFYVAKATPEFIFPSVNKRYGDTDFTLTIQSTSPVPITYISSNTFVASVGSSSGTVSITGIGSTVITASQVSSNNYNSGSSTANLVVDKTLANMADFPDINKLPDDEPFEVTPPTTDSSATIDYSILDTTIATIDNGIITILNSGTTQIIASQDETDIYAADSISATLTVGTRETTIANSPTPGFAAGPIIRSVNRNPVVQITGKLAMRGKNIPGSVVYYH